MTISIIPGVTHRLGRFLVSQRNNQVQESKARLSNQRVDKSYSQFWGLPRRSYSAASRPPFLEEKLKERSRILDLSSKDLKLNHQNLTNLLHWLQNSPEAKKLLRINWGETSKIVQSQYSELHQALNEQLKRNKESYRDRASYGECAIFANLAYENPVDVEKLQMLPSGWEILRENGKFIHWDDREKDSYYGTAFINKEQGLGVIAHRGTEFSCSSIRDVKHFFKDLFITDLIEIFGNGVGNQQASAYEFSKTALKALKAQGCHSIGLVGHSLGGWLAQLSAYHLSLEGEKRLFATTLDNPGSSRMIQQLAPRDRSSRISLVDLDFASFLSHPNLVNTCHEHEGEVFQIIPDITFSMISKFVSYFSFTIQSHDRKLQAKVFDTSTGSPSIERTLSVVSWPCLTYIKFQNELREFFKFAKAKDNFQTHDKEMRDRDIFWLNHRGHYRVKAYEPQSLRLSHFTSDVRSFLLELDQIRKFEPNILRNCEAELSVEAGAFDLFSNYEVLNGNQITILDSSSMQDAYEFRRQACQLLESYPELLTYIQFPTLFQELKRNTKETLSLVNFETLLSNQEKDLEMLMDISAMGPLQRLYLYYSASEKEIQQHEKDDKRIQHLLAKNNQLYKRLLEFKKQSSATTFETKREIVRFLDKVESHQYQLEIAQLMNQAIKAHKMKKLDDQAAQEAVSKILKYKEWGSHHPEEPLPNFSVLLSRVYSLRAKTARSKWNDGDKHLLDSMNYYEKALDYYGGDPIPYSNLGALLNDWGEWLTYCPENPDLELSAEKHAKALAFHEQAYELNPINYGILRDYGRALFLDGQAKFRLKKISEADYQLQLEKAITYVVKGRKSSSEDLIRYNPTALHFQGLIELELGYLKSQKNAEESAVYFMKALDHFDKGLREQMVHPILLFCRALARFELNKYTLKEDKVALLKSKKDLISSLQFFKERRVTPEDTYRIDRAEKLLAEIQFQLGENA